MPITAFTAKTLYTPDLVPNGVVLVEDDRVLAAGSREAIEIPSGATEVKVAGCIAPGFIDIHNHGGGGRDVMEASAEAMEVICRLLASFGTTSFYPTTGSAATADILRSVEFLADCVERSASSGHGRTHPLGIHMEGPYLSPKRRGAHPEKFVVEPTLDAYRAFARAAKGQLRIMTIAPEIGHATEVIEEMLGSGVQPSIGHTDATYEEADRAARLGARQATHMFNAMRPFRHRDPGVIAKVLSDPSIKAELIADGVHVDPKAIDMLYRAKGSGGIVLISDGISATGMPDGVYEVVGLQVEVKEGVCRYQGTLAGSVLTLDQAVRNMIEFTGMPAGEAIRMATLNTAKLMGVEDRKGCLKTGADADLLLLSDDLRIEKVYARGVEVQ